MKNILLIILIGFLSCTSKPLESDNAYVERMRAYQDSVTLSFVSGANGVLNEESLATAHAIPFFPPNVQYRVRARFEPVTDGRVFEMQTNTDRLPLYRDYGILHFQFGRDSLQLHVYQSLEHPESLFCPFKDLTNGTETYGAGRYLDFELEDMNDPLIDFNTCYNPYCAYNLNYSCPIPPAENHLQVRVEAGVKKYK